MGKLFGTDGVRGVAGKDLTCELALQIGRATAAELTSLDGHRPRILIGKDTRVSGDMLECTLAAGLCSVGADVDLLGVIPTPGVAYLVRKYGADAGIVISASHNPMEFNGIKIFKGDGYKLPDEVENRIEAHIFKNCEDIKICDGAEIRRGSRYDAVIMDPPSYGRGPNGEIWKLEDNVYDLITLTEQVLSDKPLFFAINSYTEGLSPAVMEYVLKTTLCPKVGGHTSCDEIGLPVTATGGVVPCGATAVWEE